MFKKLKQAINEMVNDYKKIQQAIRNGKRGKRFTTTKCSLQKMLKE
jgi:hypothetical protein